MKKKLSIISLLIGLFILAIFNLIPENIKNKIKTRATGISRDSKIAHKYLDGLHGIEIGGAAHNPFNIHGSINVDYTGDEKLLQENWSNKSIYPMPVNIVANGDDLPFKDSTLDYVMSSHVIEHFFDPIKTLKEWKRVIKKGGYIFIIAPHKERIFDKNRKVTSIEELTKRHNGSIQIKDYIKKNDCKKMENGYYEDCYKILKGATPSGFTRFAEDDHHHWTVWNTESFLELCKNLKLDVVEYQDVDDKVSNGFTIVIKKN